MTFTNLERGSGGYTAMGVSPRLKSRTTAWCAPITIRRVVFYTLWLAVNLIIFGYSYHKYYATVTESEKDISTVFWKASTIAIRVIFAFILVFMSQTLLSMLRLTPISRWIKFEKNVHAHKLAAYTLLGWVITHVVISYRFFYNISHMPPPPGMDPSQLESFTELLFHTPRGITGHIMLFSFFIIAVTATPIVRRRAFEVFYFCHHLFIVILVAMLIHVKLATEYFPYLGAFIIIYAVDRIYRVVRAYSSQARIHKAIPHNDGVVEVRFTAQMIQPLPGQFVRICCPSVDPLQWHPFTLTTVPGKNNTASIHFRTVGGFTREFARKLGCSSYANTVGDDADAPQFSASLDSRCSLRNDNAGQTARSLRIFVDGPYGAPTQHLFNYSVGVMIAGGIGITPFLSAMKYHLTKSIAGESTQLRRLYLIWSVRDLGALEWLGDLWEMLRVQEQQGRFADVYTVVVYYTNTKDGSNLPVKVVEDSPWGTHALDLESLSATEGPVKVPDNLPSCVQVYLYRPDYCKALRHIASQNSKTRIGVIGCGVKAMNRSVRLQLQAISGSIARDHSVHYEFRAEHF